MIEALLVALMALHPHAESTRRIEAAHARIVAEVTAASAQYDIPPVVLLSVGYQETWCGTHDGESHGYGAPIDARHRHIAGTAATAARILARGFVVCGGSWRGSVTRFRSGLCTIPRSHDHAGGVVHDYVARVRGLAERMSSRVLASALVWR